MQIFIRNYSNLFAILFLILLFQSCKKSDQVASPEKELSSLERKFFFTNRTGDLTEGKLVDFLIRQNRSKSFVEKTTKIIGFPRWEKMITVKRKNGISGRGASDSILTTYFIPFVRDSQNYVNASLIISVYPNDTTFAYRSDWEYQYKTHGSPIVDSTAEAHAVFFMFLDNRTFGYTEFSITDTNLFPEALITNGTLKKLKILNTSSSPTGRGNTAVSGGDCLLWGNYVVCPTPTSPTCSGPSGCDYLSCPNGVCRLYYGCVLWNLSSLPVGGSGPTVGTGGSYPVGTGGSGNSGGGSPSPCPGTTSYQRGQTATYGCEPGWSGTGGWGTNTQGPCITAQNAAKQMDSIYIRSKADSVLNSIPNLATEIKEKGFPIYKIYSINPNNVSDTTISGYRCDPPQTGTDSSINIIVNPRRLEALAATLHTHPNIGYAAHSAADIYSFLQYRNDYPEDAHHFLGNFVAASNGNQYAITITNQTQAAAFLATQSQFLDGEKWNRNSVIGKAFLAAKKYFEELYESYPENIHLAYEKAMAAVLNQFQTGVTLNKKDAAGNFKPIIVTTSLHPTKPNKKIYTQECL